MDNRAVVKALLESSPGGTITARQVTEQGFSIAVTSYMAIGCSELD